MIASFPCMGFNHAVVEGQWAIYHKNFISDADYHFLNIKNDLSGTLVSSLGHLPITRKFKSSDVVKRDGYIEIQFNNTEKAVISAWKLKSGEGRLAGVIYMYKESGELYNILYMPLQLLNKSHEFLSYDEIRLLSKKFR